MPRTHASQIAIEEHGSKKPIRSISKTG